MTIIPHGPPHPPRPPASPGTPRRPLASPGTPRHTTLAPAPMTSTSPEPAVSVQASEGQRLVSIASLVMTTVPNAGSIVAARDGREGRGLVEMRLVWRGKLQPVGFTQTISLTLEWRAMEWLCVSVCSAAERPNAHGCRLPSPLATRASHPSVSI